MCFNEGAGYGVLVGTAIDKLDSPDAQKKGGGDPPATAALDYVRGNLFDLSELRVVPATASGSGSNDDLNDIFDVYVAKAIASDRSRLFRGES